MAAQDHGDLFSAALQRNVLLRHLKATEFVQECLRPDMLVAPRPGTIVTQLTGISLQVGDEFLHVVIWRVLPPNYPVREFYNVEKRYKAL